MPPEPEPGPSLPLAPHAVARPPAEHGSRRPVGPSAAVVLAAGEGRRLGGVSKSDLRLPSGESFLERIVATARAAGVERVAVVVAGARPGAAPPGVAVVHNPNPEQGMLSSLQVGLRALGVAAGPAAPERAERAEPDPGVTLLWPVDCPRVPAGVVRALLETVASGEAAVAVPSRARKGGHPVAFAPEAAAALLAAPLSSSAREVLRGGAFAVRFLELEAPEVLDDVDTLEALEALGGSIAEERAIRSPATPRDADQGTVPPER
jgi:CTP:molybdopterin cytidylyltransferase MocA